MLYRVSLSLPLLPPVVLGTCQTLAYVGLGAGCGPQVCKESCGDGVQLRVRLSPARRLPVEGENLVREQVKPALHSVVDAYRHPGVRILCTSAVL